jgi:CheY-like chemotaxis protein
VNLNEVVGSVHAIISRSFGPTISIEMKLDENLFSVRGFLSHLEHILMTLCLNARDGMPAGGAITLSTFNIDLEKNLVSENISVPAGRYAVLEVDITVKGREERLPGGRFGIGSKMVSAIVENHRGFIEEKMTAGNGCSYVIYFPRWKKRLSTFKASVTQPASSRPAGTILLIDDEEGLLTMGRNMLAKIGYKTVLAKSGEEACDLFREIGNEIDLILLDIILPGMGGEETLKCLKRIRPDVKIVLTSAVALSDAKKKLFDMGIKGFLQKPFLFQDLRKIVKDVLKE